MLRLEGPTVDMTGLWILDQSRKKLGKTLGNSEFELTSKLQGFG